MEPNNRQWLFALEHPTALPRPAIDDPTAAVGTSRTIALLTDDQQLLTNAPIMQAIRYTQRSAISDSFAATGESDVRENVQIPRGNPRTRAFATELRERSGSDRAFIAAVLDYFRTEPFVYTLAAAG